MSVDRKTRLEIYARDDWRCWYCGVDLSSYERKADAPTLDHLHPVSRNGKSLKANLVTSCRSCNCQKKNMNLEEYRLFVGKARRAAALLREAMELHSTPFDDSITEAVLWLEGQASRVRFYGEKKK